MMDNYQNDVATFDKTGPQEQSESPPDTLSTPSITKKAIRMNKALLVYLV